MLIGSSLFLMQTACVCPVSESAFKRQISCMVATPYSSRMRTGGGKANNAFAFANEGIVLARRERIGTSLETCLGAPCLFEMGLGRDPGEPQLKMKETINIASRVVAASARLVRQCNRFFHSMLSSSFRLLRFPASTTTGSHIRNRSFPFLIFLTFCLLCSSDPSLS